MLSKMFNGKKGVAERRKFFIRAYIGENGAGKSLGMVGDSVETMIQGKNILSVIPIYDFRTGALYEHYIPFLDYRDLLDFENGDVLMDEIVGIASSRESQSLPVQIANFFTQLRRRNVSVSWTGTGWMRCDKVLREVTQLVTVCKGFMPTPSDIEGRSWTDNRMFYFKSYRANQFEEWTQAKEKKLSATTRNLFWRPDSVAEQTYRTLDFVSSLGWASEAGICIICGGKRSVPRCSCEGSQNAHRRHKPTRAGESLAVGSASWRDGLSDLDSLVADL